MIKRNSTENRLDAITDRTNPTEPHPKTEKNSRLKPMVVKVARNPSKA
jgi:hypothetical protein